jgi:RNA recognition motif-containing protein
MESTRVYVSGLPKDITQEELGKIPIKLFPAIPPIISIHFTSEILFGPQGKIKKIKIYEDKQGQKKGDALITYVTTDGMRAACVRVSIKILQVFVLLIFIPSSLIFSILSCTNSISEKDTYFQ